MQYSIRCLLSFLWFCRNDLPLTSHVHYGQPYYAQHGKETESTISIWTVLCVFFENVHQRVLNFLLPLGIRYRSIVLRPREASISNLIFISLSMWVIDCVNGLD